MQSAASTSAQYSDALPSFEWIPSSALRTSTKMDLPNVTPSTFGVWGVVASVVLGILVLKLFSSKYKNLPPGPRGFPVIGTMHLLGPYIHRDFAKLSATYGPVMTMWMGQKLAVVVSSAAMAKEILNTQDSNFSSRNRTSFGELVLSNGIDVVFQDDTIERNHLKKLLRVTLSATRTLQLSEGLRTEEIANVLRVMPQDGRTVVPVRTYIEVVVTNILSRMVLKKRFGAVAGKTVDAPVEGNEVEQVKNFAELIQDIRDVSFRLDAGDFVPALRRIDLLGFRRHLRHLKKRMDVFMSKIISEHLEQRQKSSAVYEKDMVDALLDEMEDTTSRFGISNEHISSLLWDTFVGGTGTTIDSVEWTLSECIANPRVMSKVQAELDTVVGKSRRVEHADIPKLEYLQATVKEMFRLHIIPLLIPHKNKTECKISGYDIPAGTTAFVCVGAIAKDPVTWENPLEFKPERFLNGSPHASTGCMGSHFELLPFGSGRRGCPGKELAVTMVHILAATLLHSFDWSLPNDMPPTDLDMSEAPGIVHNRAEPLKAIPKARLSI